MKTSYYNKKDIIRNSEKEEVVSIINEIISDFPEYYAFLIKGDFDLKHFNGATFKIGYSSLLVDNPLLNAAEIDYYKKFESSFSVKMSNCHNQGNDTSIFKLFITIDPILYEKFLKIIKVNKMTSVESTGSFVDLAPVEPYFTLKNVILNEEIKEAVYSSIFLIKNQEKIYTEWGFSKIDNKPKLILNFYGPPGTGKTMTAHSIANEFNKKILLVNYSDIESKYVGDAPKNLDEVFKVAKRTDAVLFFDEADSFLGKRIAEVSSSSDQAINSLRSQMLIMLEEFDGIVIFATNMVKNYDKAFESRILKHIKFEIPNKNERKQIIKSMLTINAPIERNVFDEDSLNELVEISEGFSGRIIKNAVLSSLAKAASQDRIETISLNYFLDGFNDTKFGVKNLEKEIGIRKIPIELKKQIENKIKEDLKSKVDVS